MRHFFFADNDVPVASISGPATVGENAGLLGDATAITVTLDRSPAREVRVAWTITAGTPAVTAADFGDGTATELPKGTLTIVAGTTSGVPTFRATPSPPDGIRRVRHRRR